MATLAPGQRGLLQGAGVAQGNPELEVLPQVAARRFGPRDKAESDSSRCPPGSQGCRLHGREEGPGEHWIMLGGMAQHRSLPGAWAWPWWVDVGAPVLVFPWGRGFSGQAGERQLTQKENRLSPSLQVGGGEEVKGRKSLSILPVDLRSGQRGPFP